MDVSLPQRLEERLRWEVALESAMARPGPAGPRRSPLGSRATPLVSGERFVLYWMHNALRGHENPALDTALCLARQNGLPLLVYQGLCETHRYASDRHHAFVLQGARDVQRQLSERGIRFAFHLQRAGARGPHLKALVQSAAIVVTEESPVEPFLGWMERLRGSTTTPILTVDTSCVVPMPMLKRLYADVAAFRKAAEREFDQRVARSWEEEPVECPKYRGRLPFEPLDLQDVDLGRLIGECSIDHSVPPVIDTPGGTRCGYARWQLCQQQPGSSGFPPAFQDASRMNPYLHYGMVSPLRIAREAHRAGATELLSKLLLHRELAHHFCFHVRDALETFEALPEWARETLLAHATDPRESELNWEQLARARTGNRFWDACQRSLLMHGELHPDAQRNWAKSLLLWTPEPRQALQWAMDLNHRFALDGRDPNSYGALLWSFGQFDRPLEQGSPVFGDLRPPEPELPLQNMDFSAFESWVDRPAVPLQPRIAVVGAGMAGLVAARIWADAGMEVTLFDRSHRVGGRLATRHAASGVSFDHGAQYFTVRDNRFARYVRAWIQAGVAAPWNSQIVEIDDGKIGESKEDLPRYVGVPDMQAVAEHLAADLKIVLETPVGPIQGEPGNWRLTSEDGRELGEFDFVIANCPPRQASAVFATQRELAETILAVPMAPCWAVMVELERPLGLAFDAAFVHHSPLSWIARNNSKPHRAGHETWVLHATAEWSQKHLEEDCDEVLVKLLTAFTAATGAHVSNPVSIAAHRWRSALPLQTLPVSAHVVPAHVVPAHIVPAHIVPAHIVPTQGAACLWEPALGLGACGDWCGGPRIEGAFLSGAAMAGSLLRYLTIDRHP